MKIEKVINNDREFVAQVIRSLPNMSSEAKQVWIENPSRLKNGLEKALCLVVKHTVDLRKAPRLPFDDAEVVKHNGKGVVEIELRSDDNLYIDGKKVGLFLSERQKGEKRIVGNELCQELEDSEQVLLNSNVLDYLFDHPELFPEHWKKDENGDTRYIFFWNSIFRNSSDGYLHVRYLCWSGGSLNRSYDCLDHRWTAS